MVCVLWLCVLQSAAEDEPQWSKRLLWDTVGRMGGAAALYFAAIGFLAEKLPIVKGRMVE